MQVELSAKSSSTIKNFVKAVKNYTEAVIKVFASTQVC